MPFLKQNMCKRFTKGNCLAGDKCGWAHSREEQHQARRQYAKSQEDVGKAMQQEALARNEQVRIENNAAEAQAKQRQLQEFRSGAKCSVRSDVQPLSASPLLGSASREGESQSMPLQHPVRREEISIEDRISAAKNCKWHIDFRKLVDDACDQKKPCGKISWADVAEEETDDECFDSEE